MTSIAEYERLAATAELSSDTVALGFCYGGIHPEFLKSIIGLAGGGDKRMQAVTSVGGLYIDNNRNSVARQFLENTQCNWLWMVDTDIQFSPDAVDKLLAASGGGLRKIVAANYWNTQDFGTATTWLRMGGGHMNPITSIPETGTVPLGACGMGCTLIHRQVFEDIAYQRRENPDPWVWFGRDLVSMQGEHQRAGEDVTFCIRALKAGHSTWGLCDLTVQHYKSQPVAVPKLALPVPSKP